MSLQSRKQSLIESLTNIGVGMILSVLITETIGVYVLGITISYMKNFWLTVILTFVSIGRSYVVRRSFNKFMRGSHDI